MGISRSGTSLMCNILKNKYKTYDVFSEPLFTNTHMNSKIQLPNDNFVHKECYAVKGVRESVLSGIKLDLYNEKYAMIREPNSTWASWLSFFSKRKRLMFLDIGAFIDAYNTYLDYIYGHEFTLVNYNRLDIPAYRKALHLPRPYGDIRKSGVGDCLGLNSTQIRCTDRDVPYDPFIMKYIHFSHPLIVDEVKHWYCDK